jgi:Zn-dependent membrane protease YugP
MYWIIIIGSALLGALVSGNFRRKFAKYSQMPTSSGLSGKEVAEKMLRENGIYDVKVIAGEGFDSDFYDPAARTVSLSPDVYSGRSVTAAAVAAHESGHAVQHHDAYSWLTLRTTLVPAVKFTNKISPFLIIAILIGGFVVQGLMPQLILVYIIVLALTTLFSLITLPVEIDASRRAVAWLRTSNVTMQGQELDSATDALKAAAYTYVVAALASLAYLLYWVGILRD